jgi:phosphoenolpyruvate---glycerone phosphotransferase subunit DhaL
MSVTIGYDDLVRMLNAAVQQIKGNHETLSQLDSHGGDGDHGTTMVRAMGILERAVIDCPVRQMGDLLHGIGWAIMGVDGGATGPLFGTLFMSMADAAGDGDPLDASGLAAMFEAGLAGVRKRTKAQPGDKTMIDALVPGVEALRAAADSGAEVPEAMGLAAEAAQQGAESTKTMQARFGRAKNIGEKSVGEQDPGATSVAFMFRGFSQGVTTDG